MAPIEIPLNKSRLSLMALGSAAFVCLGLWFCINRSQIGPESGFGTTGIVVVGILAIVFFGLCGVAILIKLFNAKPGVIIDQNGITDNSGPATIGLIDWNDIISVKTAKAGNQDFIVVIVRNPQYYIDRHKNLFEKKIMDMNYAGFDSPIYISLNSLKCSCDELYNLILSNTPRK